MSRYAELLPERLAQRAKFERTHPPCLLVKMARERHERDLEKVKHDWFPYKFRPELAEYVLAFSEKLKHSKTAKWAGKPFVLELWEGEIVSSLFGWVRKDNGVRKYSDALVSTPRKQGKTCLLAMVSLYLTIADREPVAEIYVAAVRFAQANELLREAIRMVQSNSELRKLVTVRGSGLSVASTGSSMAAVPASADGLLGLNPHGVVYDEFAFFRDRRVYESLDTASQARSQPLRVAITTAGLLRETVGFERYTHAVRVLEQVTEDETFYCWISGLDKGDDYKDSRLWYKALPNLGVTVELQRLVDSLKRVEASPAGIAAFRRFHLNEWSEQTDRLLEMPAWRACGGKVDAEALKGLPCWGGLDLSSTVDFTAAVLLFPIKEGDGPEIVHVLPFFWLPSQTVTKRGLTDRMPYGAWREEGILRVTEGNAIDHEQIIGDILKLAKTYKIKELAVDPAGALTIMQNLIAGGMNVTMLRQGYQLSPALSKLQALIADKKLLHGSNPCLDWMASNCVARTNAEGASKVDKGRSLERVDGITALVTALFRLYSSEVRKKSVYASRGVLTV